jgi:glutathione S-transferase
MARKVNQAKTRTQKVKFEAEKQLQAIQAAAQKRAKELQEQIEEAEKAEKQAIEEEEKRFKETEAHIQEISKDNGYFCGIVLTKADILAIVDLAIDSKENIKIPFRLYITDEEEAPSAESKTEGLEKSEEKSQTPPKGNGKDPRILKLEEQGVI